MKSQQTTETHTGCATSALKWGKAVGYGIAIGTLVGTVGGIVTKQTAFIYIGMLLGAAIGFIFKSKPTKSD